MIPKTSTPINQRLVENSQEIALKTSILVESRRLFKLAKAEYDYKYHQIYMTNKAQDINKTQGDLKAEAILGSHEEQMQLIKAESSYQKVKLELQALRDEKDNLQEASYNLREELRSLKGTDSYGNPSI